MAGWSYPGRHEAGALALTRGPLRSLLAGALTVLAVIALARAVDGARLSETVRTAPREPLVLVAAAAAYTAAFAIRAVAWRMLLRTEAGFGALFPILQAALFLNHVLPFRAGEIARPVLAVRRGIPASEAVSTTAIARLLDFAALLLIALVAVPRILRDRETAAAVAAVAVLILGAIAALALVRTGAAERLGRRVSPRLPARIEVARAALREIPLRQVGFAAPLVIVSWVLEGAVVMAAAHLLGVELGWQAAVGATAFTVLLQVVHLTPGGLGVYEASMSGVLMLFGLSAEDALALAVLTHGMKFAYSFTVGLAFGVSEGVQFIAGRADTAPRLASRLEVIAARLWNVINEGKPFTPVFAITMLAVLVVLGATGASSWTDGLIAFAAVVPMALVFWRFDFPLRLRAVLWAALLLWVVLFRSVSVPGLVVVLTLYLLFTVVLWGTVYYHLRIGTPWTNFLRFWRLVLENPDPTSGNFLEQVPKLLLLVFALTYVARDPSWAAVGAVEAFVLGLGVVALLTHQWWFTWVPALPQAGYRRSETRPERVANRVIVIAIDGCRADRLREAHTPVIDRLRAEGTDYVDVSTVYPARTVTCFSSMLTGAPPQVHGMHSNFVPSLGIKCDSVFRALERNGMSGKLVGIAHLIDAFGEEDVRSVTAVMHNDEIDFALVARAREVLEQEDPELLVLQLLSVDQTGHSRGSYNDEYLHKIEATDAIIGDFLDWCRERGYLEGATLLITADHGQGIGIGGHGHMSPTEIHIPCILWGESVEAGRVVEEPRFITDIAPTLCHLLGAATPEASIGRALLPVAEGARREITFVIPAHNEEVNLPPLLRRIAALPLEHVRTIVVDDGSTDRTADVAAAHGATVVRHERNRGLGAALRTGLAAARDFDPAAVVYLDADGEYFPEDAPALLAPILAGEADYVLGSRFRGRPEGMTRSRRFANSAFSLLLSVLCGRWISDGQTGIRAFSPRALAVAEIVHDYNYAQVLTLDLLHKGMRMTEVPARYERRRHGRSFISAQYLWRVPAGIAQEMWRG